MAERSLWVDPPPLPPRPQQPTRPHEPPREPEPGPPEPSTVRLACLAGGTGLVVLSTLLGISGDWFSSGPGVSYLAAWSGGVFVVTALVVVAATVRIFRAGRDASLAVGVAALVWAGQVAALLTGLGEEAVDVGPGAAGAAAGLPAALGLAFDGLATGRAEWMPRWMPAAAGFTLGAVLAVALTLLPLGEPQSSFTIIR